MKTTNTFNIDTYFLSFSITLVIFSIIGNSFPLFISSLGMIIIVISCIFIKKIRQKKNFVKN